MNSEREIVKRLFESKDYEDEIGNDPIDEKTYTVGDKQYWKRGGQCYCWTASDGRKECSEDEYNKAISGDNVGGGSSVASQATSSKESPSNNAADNKSKDSATSKKPAETNLYRAARKEDGSKYTTTDVRKWSNEQLDDTFGKAEDTLGGVYELDHTAKGKDYYKLKDYEDFDIEELARSAGVEYDSDRKACVIPKDKIPKGKRIGDLKAGDTHGWGHEDVLQDDNGRAFVLKYGPADLSYGKVQISALSTYKDKSKVVPVTNRYKTRKDNKK